jgi:hypothetical protein
MDGNSAYYLFHSFSAPLAALRPVLSYYMRNLAMPEKISLPTSPEFKESMLSGRKRGTTRTRRYGNPGDRFRQFGRTYILTSVQRTYLDLVVRDHYVEEGFSSPGAFIEFWDMLHPRVPYAKRPTRTVYYHCFISTRSNYHRGLLKMVKRGKFNRSDLTPTQMQERARRRKQRIKMRGMPNPSGTRPRQFTLTGEPVYRPTVSEPIDKMIPRRMSK